MIKLYDTMQRKKVVFEPVKEGKVGIYICGPTVYNYIHIGNARTFISFDVVRRYFMWRGYEVTFVQNITDVDDKIINKANEEGVSTQDISERYTQAFIEDMRSVGVLDPDIRPQATQEIGEMISLITRLIENGNAYEVEGDVYYSVESYTGYGELSHRSLEDMESGHRDLRGGNVADDRKRNEFDFALWKAAKEGEPSWPSPWGEGRPGWHIECSAMSERYLGLPFDIHGGGADLIFPHHENERAQTEAACGCGYANYWMHGGMLQINSEKMSKSLGNFMLLRELLKTVEARVLRMLMMQTHYRSPLDFSQDRLAEADAALQRIETAYSNIEWMIANAAKDEPPRAEAAFSEADLIYITEAVERVRSGFIYAMDDDFNTAGALGEVFAFVSDINAVTSGKTATARDVLSLEAICETLADLVGVFGIAIKDDSSAQEFPEGIVDLASRLIGFGGSGPAKAAEALLEFRTQARTNKDWGAADAVRDGLGDLGLVVEDTPQGPRLLKK